MSLYTKAYFKNLSLTTKSIDLIKESGGLGEINKPKRFDIFLSHSYLDKPIISGIFQELTNFGFEVYVDWIHDPDMVRNRVTKRTVSRIQNRMSNCKCLFYATSSNAYISKWMPWELGYMSGKTSRCAILPVFEKQRTSFKGQEFLSAYPYVSKELNRKGKQGIYINESPKKPYSVNQWLKRS